MPLTQVSSRLIEDTLRYVLGASGTSHYTLTGKGLTGAVNDPTLTLSRGHTYIFENRSGGHPFYIKTSIANGGTNDAYNTGVTNNGGGNGTEIVFTVPHDAPDTLYYQCSSHSSMAGQLSISGSVADGSITESKLADDAVTADKLANSINTAIAANTAKDLTALSASNLTSGTVPDARFPATLPAASAANLTSIPAANLTGALPAISGAALTNLVSGLTEVDLWRITSNFSNYQEPITSGWSRNTTGPGLANIGTGLSENGGTFTFPSTGIWEVVFHADYRHNEDLPRVYGMIRTTTNNSSYSNLFEATGSTSHADSHYHHGFVHVHGLIDCTDTSNIKFNLGVNHANTTNSSNITWYGSTSQIRSYMYVKKRAET